MTGDIRTKLSSSEAAESLRMERFIAGCFRAHRWPAEQGVYFSDPETGKAREIDVICRKLLERPVRRKGLGAPIINLSIICECKSLSGLNVLLSKGDIDPEIESIQSDVIDCWSGHDEHLTDVVELISRDPPYRRCNKYLLYSYCSDRAHPDGMQLNYFMKLPQPPVDLIATAFRATKGGTDEREAANPLWSAIQSTLSAIKAAEREAVETTRSWTFDKPYRSKPADLMRNIAFFFDTELARRVSFHPVIFCKSRLFNIDDDLADVRSARIFVRNLDFDFRYVDLVRFDSAAAYIDAMLSHFEKEAYKSIRKTWDRMEDLQWQPGQASNRLARALGLPRRSRPRSTKRRR